MTRRQRFRRGGHTLVATFLAIAGLTACGGGAAQGEADGTTTVRLGLQPLWEYAPWVVAQQMGFDEEQGLNLDITWMSQVGPEVQAMLRGDLDVISTCTACNFAFYESAPTLNDFMITDQYKGFIVVGRQGAPTFDGLVEDGTTPEQAQREIYDYVEGKTFVLHEPVFGPLVEGMVENASLEPDDVTIVDAADDAKGATAFRSGEGDFYMGGTPSTTKLLEDEGTGFVSMGGSEILGPAGLWYSTMASTDEWLADNEEAAQKLVAVWYRTMKLLEERPDETIESMRQIVNQQSGSDFTLDQAKVVVQELDDFFTLQTAGERAYDPASDVYWNTGLEYYTAQSVSSGVIPEDLDVGSRHTQEQFYRNFLQNEELVEWVNSPLP